MSLSQTFLLWPKVEQRNMGLNLIIRCGEMWLIVRQCLHDFHHVVHRLLAWGAWEGLLLKMKICVLELRPT